MRGRRPSTSAVTGQCAVAFRASPICVRERAGACPGSLSNTSTEEPAPEAASPATGPRFASLRRYAGEGLGLDAMVRFVKNEVFGTFTWDEVARYRDRWQGPLVVKGLLHPADAERAIALGADGIIVSNHGGRQVEGLPASVDALPGIVSAAEGRAAIMMDSGVSSGLDVVRAIALGATATFAGKAFLWALGALGDQGPEYLVSLIAAEVGEALGQIGAPSVADAGATVTRHPGRLAT